MTLGVGVQLVTADMRFDRTPLQSGVIFRLESVSFLANGRNKGVHVQQAMQSVAKHFSVIIRDSGTGNGASLTPALLSALVVKIKKGGLTSYSTIAPTLTAVGTTGLLDLALTAIHLDTLGVAAINITGPAVIPNDDIFIDVLAVNLSDPVRAGLTALPNAAAGVSGGLPAIDANLNVASDVKRWLTVAPATLTTNGLVKAMLTRWLTDDAGGTPNALDAGNVPTSGTGGPTAEDVADAIMAFVLRAGDGSDPDSTVLGHLRRMDALFFAKVTGLLGALVRAYQPGGAIVEFSAAQDTEAGTRDEVDRTTSETP